MKVVKKFTDSFSANVARGMLENNGITAVVLNDNIRFTAGILNTDLLSIDLAVDDKDYSEACRLLAAASSAE